MKYKLEYVWLDGYKPEPNLRSKIKVMDLVSSPNFIKLSDIPTWSFDGSSTQQAEGRFSDLVLKPVKLYYHSIIKEQIPTIYVLCEVMYPDGNAHETNKRNRLTNDKDFWVGFEQEYFLRSKYNGKIAGMDKENIEEQGRYYCGVGMSEGRSLVEKHLDTCLSLGIDINGVNAEVAIGQWEFQVFAKGNVDACDDLWMSRYILAKLAETYGYTIEYHPKPLGKSDWNGSGLHTNFSNKTMREEGDEQYYKDIFQQFEYAVHNHMSDYGSDNHLRLTGKHETQAYDKFSWGVADRGASLRISPSTAKTWKGYIEDRRPSSNANPYLIIYQIMTTIWVVDKGWVIRNETY